MMQLTLRLSSHCHNLPPDFRLHSMNQLNLVKRLTSNRQIHDAIAMRCMAGMKSGPSGEQQEGPGGNQHWDKCAADMSMQHA